MKLKKIKPLDNPKVSFPSIKWNIDKITKILNKKNINVAFTPINTIRNMIDSGKDRIDPKQQKGVYSIPCSRGNEYIGEAGRSVGIRFKEHITDIARNRTWKSSLSEHAFSSSYYICMENAKIVHKETHYLKRRIKEAIEIEKRPNTMNGLSGHVFSSSYYICMENAKIIHKESH